MTFGKFIERRMKDYGISQAELSRMTGLPDATISHIILGKHNYPQRRVVIALCKALDICPDVLMRVIRKGLRA